MASCRMPLPRPIFRRSTVLYAGSPRRVDINESNFGQAREPHVTTTGNRGHCRILQRGVWEHESAVSPPCFPPLWCPFRPCRSSARLAKSTAQQSPADPFCSCSALEGYCSSHCAAPVAGHELADRQALHPRWHEVQVCTLPKVHTVKLPKQVRPISILHPCNKVMASLLAARVLPKVAAFLESVPQWAYLPGRSTADALEAVCSHLQAVRLLVQSKSTTLVQRHRGAQPTKLAGGVSISLDIHKAFDSLSHALLAEAMRTS